MTDQNGHYWEIMLRLPATKVSINLPSMPASTNITTGQYRYNCRYGGKPRRNAGYAITNLEAKFSLETEAYIEKLE